MSSLAAARADNFYHPPEWDPRKKSRDRYQGSKGSNQYEKKGVIRFEMPFNVKCLGCQAMIGKGVRFNAKKDHVGNYFSTKIWRFSMTCHHCHHPLQVSTDPKNADYALTAGLERKVETYDAAEAGTAELISADERERIAQDPFTNLEHKGAMQQKAAADKPIISQLQSMSKDRWKDDYQLNRNMRRKFRSQKVEIKAAEEQKMQDISRTGVPLLPTSTEDRVQAARVNFVGLGAAAQREKKRQGVLSSSIFGPSVAHGSKAMAVRRVQGRPSQVVTPSAITKRVVVRKKPR